VCALASSKKHSLYDDLLLANGLCFTMLRERKHASPNHLQGTWLLQANTLNSEQASVRTSQTLRLLNQSRSTQGSALMKAHT
jgi:hypothetical protein